MSVYHVWVCVWCVCILLFIDIRARYGLSRITPAERLTHASHRDAAETRARRLSRSPGGSVRLFCFVRPFCIYICDAVRCAAAARCCIISLCWWCRRRRHRAAATVIMRMRYHFQYYIRRVWDVYNKMGLEMENRLCILYVFIYLCMLVGTL